jgi:signal transduction histidine kinase
MIIPDADANKPSEAFLVMRDNLIIEADSGFYSLTGYSMDEIYGREIGLFLRQSLRMTYPYQTDDIKAESFETFIFTKLLEPREVHVSCECAGPGPVWRLNFIEKTDSRLETVLPYVDMLLRHCPSSGIAYFCITPEIILLKANTVFINLLGGSCNSSENVTGKPIDAIIQGWRGSEYEQMWQTLLATGEPLIIDEYAASGQRYFKLSLIPIIRGTGIKYVIVVIEEITKEVSKRMAYEQQAKVIRQQEQQLEAIIDVQTLEKEALKEAMEMKDEFISFITHELKTPLTVINSAIQAIEFLCNHELSDRTKGFLGKIRQNTFRLIRLANNLLDITKINAGKAKLNYKNLDIVFLSREITESVRLYAQNKGVNLHFSSTLTRKIIGIAEEKYERILLNLLSNAIKFTPVGKSIYVRLSYKARQKRICLEVSDEGVGIPEDKQQTIFERFGQVDNHLTRQAEGTGIGLALVKKLVKILNGEIVLKSNIAEGSSFYVYLPTEKATESKKTEALQFSGRNDLIQATAIELSDIYL